MIEDSGNDKTKAPLSLMPRKNQTGQSEAQDGPARDMILSHPDAEAASPDDVAVCGEEDPGAALELLVRPSETREKQEQQNERDK